MRERACEEEQEQEETDGRTRTDGPRTDGDGAAGGGRERRVKEDDVGGGAGVHAISPRRGEARMGLCWLGLARFDDGEGDAILRPSETDVDSFSDFLARGESIFVA